MIRIDRGSEPTWLAGLRAERLEGARQAFAAGGQPDTSGYQEAREPLWHAQHLKCCWCEIRLGLTFNDVEHYRPKSLYWWLAWSWENLFFACAACNRSHKRTRFPLDQGSVPLVPEEQPPGGERPLLIDPSSEDPEEHIRFQRIGGHWTPVSKNGSLKGYETIRILGLDRMELVEQYDAHALQVEQILLRTEPSQIEAQVQYLTRVSAPFAALTAAILTR